MPPMTIKLASWQLSDLVHNNWDNMNILQAFECNFYILKHRLIREYNINNVAELLCEDQPIIHTPCQ